MFSARFCNDLGMFLQCLAVGRTRNQIEAKRCQGIPKKEPKGGQKVPKGSIKGRRESQREEKGGQKVANGPEKKPKGSQEVPKCRDQRDPAP
jgi:hypothetical protein